MYLEGSLCTFGALRDMLLGPIHPNHTYQVAVHNNNTIYHLLSF